MPCAPYAGDGVGLSTVPPIGARVWIEFEGGDPDYPIWSGGWWGEDELPKDEMGAGGTPQLKILRSEEGLIVALDDSAGTITLSDSRGSNLVTIKVNEGGVRIAASAEIVVEAPRIELVDGAGHPLVFGDSLLQYLNTLVSLFNAHLHPGELADGHIPVTPAPPVSPFPPATPALLSTRSFTG
jgi:hypothetical protein